MSSPFDLKIGDLAIMWAARRDGSRYLELVRILDDHWYGDCFFVESIGGEWPGLRGACSKTELAPLKYKIDLMRFLS